MKINKVSAGLMMFRRRGGTLEIFLAHPGGPYLKNKDWGYWGIPKGEIESGEELLAAAVREFAEETGLTAAGDFMPLGSVVQASGKVVHAWAFEGDWEEERVPASNLFPLEWPPGSGRQQWFPEIDQAAFFPVPLAMRKINRAQGEFIVRLQTLLAKSR
ncbi:NUDIX domain-containing protein [Anaeroselena agilis]|uniref:NUDIX domain-containing protein n=1 Tax=Anaeroselena agilis TaxID=3063788 RepID=A0ABU3P378_9FIRM|nr:NUDIX domain-containing protein [Selenomonadales bacterium 4137-cl]